MSIKIVAAEGKLLKKYINFPHELYADDLHYVPELYMAQKDMFNRKKNPFFKHAEVKSFLAEKDGKTIGRISAILNYNYNEYHNCMVGFFGFFDVINDYQAAKALLDTAVEWCRAKGCNAILGPTNFSTNDTAGILVDGYHEPAKIMMTYNKPYYKDLVEQYGFEKDIDLYAYILYTAKASERSIRLAQSLEERLNRQGITFRNINLKKFKSEVAAIRDIYNDAWANNWGFVPWTDAELDHLANELKMLANTNWIFMAEHNGKPIGFGLTIHDVNEVTKSFKKGRLFPFNIIKLLRNKNKTRFVPSSSQRISSKRVKKM